MTLRTPSTDGSRQPRPSTDAEAMDALRAENAALREEVARQREALQQQEVNARMLTHILDHLPVLIGYWDRSMRNQFSNTAYLDWFGLSRDQITGRHLREVIGEHLYAQNLPYAQRALAGEMQRFEREIRNPVSGQVRYSLADYIPSENNGQIVGFFVLVTDITELKLAQDAVQRSQAQLREREERYRSMLMDQTELISRLRGDGTYLFANDVFCRFFNKRQEELLGATWSPLVHPDDLERVGQELSQLSKDNSVVMIENRVVAGDGQVYWMQFSNRGFFSESGDLLEIQSVGRDITARKNAEFELLRLNQALTLSRRTLRDMAAHNEKRIESERKNIAREVHDELGQILTALRMDILYLEMIYCAQNADLASKVRGMKALVDQTIQGVRNVAANLRPVVLDMGLIVAIGWLCSEFSRKTSIACAFYPKDQALQANEQISVVLFRIIQESLTNITRHAKATRVEVTLTLEQRCLVCTVKDNGQGFDPNHHAGTRTFGLLGMQERALALGGQLTIDSRPGHGCCVALSIPLDTQGKDALEATNP